MKSPKCQHEECTESSVCYLSENKLYLCQHHHLDQYLDYDPVPLVDDSTVEMNLRTIEICRKVFIVFTQMMNEGQIPLDEEDLSTTVREELNHIFNKLKEAQETNKHYELYRLLNKTVDIKDILQKNQLYVEFLVTRAWDYSLSAAKGESLKSSELVEIELKREYKATFDRIARKFRDLRHGIEQRHQKEIDELRQKNQTYKEEKKSLKREKKQLITDYNKLCDDYNELDQRTRQLEIDVASLKEASKEKGEKISELQKHNRDSKQKKKILKIKLKEEQASHQASIEDLTKKINDLKDNVKSLWEDIKETKMRNGRLIEENKRKERDYEQMKQSLLTKLNLSEYSDLSLFYKIITGEHKQIEPETMLTLKLDNPKHMEFLRSLNTRMPEIDGLNLDNIPLNCQEVKMFLAIHFPNQVRTFNFNCDSPLSSTLSFYLDELTEVSQRVSGWLFIHRFEVSQDQIVYLFSVNGHQEYFGFSWCKLDLSSVPEFGGSLAGNTIKALGLYSCGGSSYCDWGNNESHFANLIAGLSKEEDFRKNLGWIDILECGMEKIEVEKILMDNGFGHVEIASHSK
ncbi:unnamed protein product [Moneuplotes crassus]|uniref:Uncharacterized protein n=1 Tax=Euplotes crassus TaxID=5936 RepID=A0AAD1XA00_EUPCR|nr:unnamed protein product [Moneuplotes crassus]